jgi:class 3 adenylate cyclase
LLPDCATPPIPEQVLLSKAIIDRLVQRQSEQIVDLEPMQLKGKSQPLPVFTLDVSEPDANDGAI